LLKLEEERRKDLNQTSQRKQSIKMYFDQSTTINNLQKGEMVLLKNKAKENMSMHTNFEALWIRPYVVEKILGFNSYMLQDVKGKRLMFHANKKHLKGFFSQRLSQSHCT
jgi:hypothetical protein